MKVEYVEVELAVLVDENGDYGVGSDAESAAANYTESIGEIDGQVGVRRVVVKLKVPKPTAIEVAGEAAVEEEGEVGLVVK